MLVGCCFNLLEGLGHLLISKGEFFGGDALNQLVVKGGLFACQLAH